MKRATHTRLITYRQLHAKNEPPNESGAIVQAQIELLSRNEAWNLTKEKRVKF